MYLCIDYMSQSWENALIYICILFCRFCKNSSFLNAVTVNVLTLVTFQQPCLQKEGSLVFHIDSCSL